MLFEQHYGYIFTLWYDNDDDCGGGVTYSFSCSIWLYSSLIVGFPMIILPEVSINTPFL
jgi:hypothetical protein